MKDLESQIAAYAKQLDMEAPPLGDLTPETDGHRSADVVDLEERRATPAWLLVGAAAAAVALVFGSVAVFGSLRGDDDEQVVATTTTDPLTSTTLGELPTPVERDTPVTLVSPIPVIGKSVYDADDKVKYFTIGDIAIDGGSFHTLLGVEGHGGLYHAVSVDGSEWSVTEPPTEVLGLDTAMDLRATTLIPMPDGTWRGYFDIGQDLGGFGDHRYKWWVHLGTAPDIEGPWTIDPQPVINEGSGDDWDAGWIRDASVIKTAEGWVMYYLGSQLVSTEFNGQENTRQVGRATSTDGVTWTKQPAPVFAGDRAIPFEDGDVSRVEVKASDSGLIMTYAGRTGGTRGIAYSADGQDWVRDDRNPVLTTLEVPRASIFDTALIDDGGLWRWYAAGGGFTGIAVYELRLDL